MSNSRTHRTKKNIKAGLLNSVVSIILPFVVRTIIIYSLGAEYVGLSSLFTSILGVLNMAELGFSTAIVFNMYKPIAEKDIDKVCALLFFYKKIYMIIGTIIFTIGIALAPFIPKLISGNLPSGTNIYILYIIYLLSTTSSYFFSAYKSAVLDATQRNDLINYVHFFAHLLRYLAEIIVLLLFQNYYIYAIIAIITSIINNILIGCIANKEFPEYKCYGKINLSDKNQIKKQVGGLMLGKLCDISRNSFDSIVLSTYFGLTTVAIYNNYYFIYNGIYALLIVITHAMQASVGNSIAVESIEKNYRDLKKFQFIFAWISGWCVVCMLCLYQPFMTMWVGKKLLLSFNNMILFCIYFYAITANCIRNLYFTGNGLWWRAKYTFIFEAIGNLFLNIFLGKLFGIAGVLIATIITIIVFNYILRTNLLFSEYFKKSPYDFYIKQIKYTIIICICSVVTFICCEFIETSNNVLNIILFAIICVIIPNILFVIINFNNLYLKESFEFFKVFLGIKK